MPALDKSNLDQNRTRIPGGKLGLGLVGAGAFGEFCLDAYAELENISIAAVADVDFQHGGVSEQFAVEVSAHYETPNRQEQYQQAIQAGMRDLIAAIKGRKYIKVSLDEAILSLPVALAARDGGSEKEFSLPDWREHKRE